jgi:hypothetical protein
MKKENFKDLCLIKIIRAIIIFISIYFTMKYCTIGKIPYTEIIMISSVGVMVQTLLDIYRPIIIVEDI